MKCASIFGAAINDFAKVGCSNLFLMFKSLFLIVTVLKNCTRDERTQNTCSRTVVFCSVLQNTEQNRTEHGDFSRPELEQNQNIG